MGRGGGDSIIYADGTLTLSVLSRTDALGCSVDAGKRSLLARQEMATIRARVVSGSRGSC